MPECSKCNTSVPAHARLCPDCGAPVLSAESPSPQPTPMEDIVHALLLNAHLLKIRGDSEAAINECIKALRVNPDSVEAHSLLGDIYKSQGKIEEAVHWYKLALDLSPESQMNRDRLSQINPGKPLAHKPQAGIDKRVSFLKRYRLAAEVFGAVLLMLIVALILRGPGNNPRQPAGSPPEDHAVSPQTPATVSPVTPRIESRIEERVPGTPVSTNTENELVRQLNASQLVRDYGLRVVSIVMDPRYDFATISFTNSYSEGGLTIDMVVKNSFIVMKTAFGLEGSPSNITVRALYNTPGSQTELIFVADSTRDQASQIDPETSTYEEALSALSNVWHHQDLGGNR